MRGMWGSYYSRYGVKSGAWLAAIAFMFIAILVVLLVPPVIMPGPDRNTVLFLVHIMAALFAALGVFFVIEGLGDWYLGTYYPDYRDLWDFWCNYIGALFGIGLFVVPAALTFPGLMFAYFMRPDIFFGAEATLSQNTVLAALLLSAIGTTCLVYMLSMANDWYRTRPRTLL